MAAQPLCRLARRFGALADFVLVYINEAHASDEWPIGLAALGKGIERPAHRSHGDRMLAAQALLRRLPLHEHGFTICLDSHRAPGLEEAATLSGATGDHFDRAFPSWPFRFWVVQHGKIALRADLKRRAARNESCAAYHVRDLQHWLERWEVSLQSHSQQCHAGT